MRMILMKVYLDFGYFPIFVRYCFIHYCLYGEVEENELIDGLSKYLPVDERQIIDVALKSDCNEVFTRSFWMFWSNLNTAHLLIGNYLRNCSRVGEIGAVPENTFNGILLVVIICATSIKMSGLRQFTKTLPRSRTYLQKFSRNN